MSSSLFEHKPGGFAPAFEAQYGGEDACCGQGIEPGQMIRSDGDGGWIHASHSTSRPEPEVCRQCWLRHAGECF